MRKNEIEILKRKFDCKRYYLQFGLYNFLEELGNEKDEYVAVLFCRTEAVAVLDETGALKDTLLSENKVTSVVFLRILTEKERGAFFFREESIDNLYMQLASVMLAKEIIDEGDKA